MILGNRQHSIRVQHPTFQQSSGRAQSKHRLGGLLGGLPLIRGRDLLALRDRRHRAVVSARGD
jgi:hypothetical protein